MSLPTSLRISEEPCVIGDDTPSLTVQVLASRHSAVCFQHDARLSFDARHRLPHSRPIRRLSAPEKPLEHENLSWQPILTVSRYLRTGNTTRLLCELIDQSVILLLRYVHRWRSVKFLSDCRTRDKNRRSSFVWIKLQLPLVSKREPIRIIYSLVIRSSELVRVKCQFYECSG